MPSVFGRRYYRGVEALGPTEVALGLFILVLVAGVVGGFAVQTVTSRSDLVSVEPAAAVHTIPLESPFPEPGVDGWRAPKTADQFSAQNLYLKIDGRAEVYLQFNVVGLTFGTYYHETDTEWSIDVYWYDMGEAVNAFGIYQAEAPPEAAPATIGRQGYQVGGAVFFWQGRGYVQVLPAGSDSAHAEAAMEIARQIASRIEDTGEGMWALDLLPESGRVPGSLAFLARGAFGLDFLSEVFTATYDVEGARVTLFIHRADDEASASSLLKQYERFFGRFGRVTWQSRQAAQRMVAGKVGGLVDVVFVKGRYLGGVTGADDGELARKMAIEFHDGLSVP
jgi:hypothetical protein